MTQLTPTHRSSKIGVCAGLIRACMLWCMLCGGFHLGGAAAADSPAAAQAPAARFASVWRIRGEVTAQGDAAAPARILRQDDPVFVGERIRAGAAAEAVLKTDDAGLIAIRPLAEFVVQDYAAKGEPGDRLTLHLNAGGMRVITGWIGRANSANHVLRTQTATIGVRGTDHEPYALTPELARAHAEDEGTYDKVNRGGTTLIVGANRLDIDPGKVGFAASAPPRTRALMTLLLPVLLDEVPGFYVPGGFDGELDRLSQTAEADTARALQERRAASPAAPAAGPAAADPPSAPARSIEPAATPENPPQAPPPTARNSGACAPDRIARQWLSALDAALARRDAAAIIRQFAPEATVRVTARGAGNAPTTLEMGRDEMARSAVAALAGLASFRQTRPSIEGRDAPGSAGACARIAVRSVVIEQGRQNGKPYRFESVEQYVLEPRGGLWLAVSAETAQR